MGQTQTRKSMYLAIYHSRSSTKRVLLKAHDIKTGGHLGINKTCEKLKDHFYWPPNVQIRNN
jgi:hypothetical protein